MNYKYLGAGPRKDRVRRLIYDACLEHWERYGHPLGDALVLCGPAPKDAQELHRLGIPPASCWFVDHQEAEALAQVSVAMPGARTYFGELEFLLSRLSRLSFVNLDLMSNVTTIDHLLVSVVQKMTKEGVVAVTFVCGREHPKVARRRLLEEGGGNTFEEARWRFLKKKMDGTGRTCMELLRTVYRDNKMSMACVVFAVR